MFSDPANVSRRSAPGRQVVAHHLGKEIDVVIAFAGHLFANRVKFLKKMWTLVHLNHSETRNSGVTISGTKKPAVVLKSLILA